MWENWVTNTLAVIICNSVLRVVGQVFPVCIIFTVYSSHICLIILTVVSSFWGNNILTLPVERLDLLVSLAGLSKKRCCNSSRPAESRVLVPKSFGASQIHALWLNIFLLLSRSHRKDIKCPHPPCFFSTMLPRRTSSPPPPPPGSPVDCVPWGNGRLQLIKVCVCV